MYLYCVFSRQWCGTRSKVAKLVDFPGSVSSTIPPTLPLVPCDAKFQKMDCARTVHCTIHEKSLRTMFVLQCLIYSLSLQCQPHGQVLRLVPSAKYDHGHLTGVCLRPLPTHPNRSLECQDLLVSRDTSEPTKFHLLPPSPTHQEPYPESTF